MMICQLLRLTVVVALAGAAITCLTAPAFTQPPVEGIYVSSDLGGNVLTGRYSDSWSGPDGRLAVLNTLHETSWDGASTGTQWSINCNYIAAPPTLLVDGVQGHLTPT